MDGEQRLDSQPINKRKGFMNRIKSWADGLAVIVKFLFYGFLAISFIGFFGAFGSDSTTTQNVLEGTGPEKVALIDLQGTIVDESGSNSLELVETRWITPRNVIDLFNEIKKDPLIKAVVLRINSPGGSVTASDEIYTETLRFKEETGLPVIASLGEVAASGGYYIALGAETIVADPASLTGSIGVVSSSVNIQELANRYGVRDVTVTSGEHKAFLNPLDEVSEEERQILQSIVDQVYTQFIDRITESRGDRVSRETIDELADGRPLSGLQAAEAGFVDRTGNLRAALELASDSANVTDPLIVQYKSGSFIESLLGAVGERIIPRSQWPIDILTKLNGQPAYFYLPAF